MASLFGWVDFSDEDREKMYELIRLFSERDTRDELGIGSVRDALANSMFPGTSTIQTRAKYMLFVPWIYLDLERKGISGDTMRDRSRSVEIELILQLLKGEDTGGVIGSDARAGLKRLPSNIYWAGLGVWGIRQFNGSQSDYYRSLRAYYDMQKDQIIGDDKEVIGGGLMPNWHAGLPKAPKDFPLKATLELTSEEAEYLSERIELRCKDSLLSYMVQSRYIVDCNFPWEHTSLKDLPPWLVDQVEHSRNFSEIIHGSALLYNLLLSQKVGNEDLIDRYKISINSWEKKIRERKTAFRNWDLNEFWKMIRLAGPVDMTTRKFVDRWIGLVLDNIGDKDILAKEGFADLILYREWSIKRSRARLHNERYLEIWSGGSGTAQLDYRWGVVNNIINDIVKGLGLGE